MAKHATARANKEPGEFIHGLNDVPPPPAFIGFQHVSLVRIQLIFPALAIQLAELPTEASVNILSFSLMALGVAAILQSLPRGPVGSRYLCPSCHESNSRVWWQPWRVLASPK
jgi:NCS2 family nucleobase:cation symporter-2